MCASIARRSRRRLSGLGDDFVPDLTPPDVTYPSTPFPISLSVPTTLPSVSPSTLLAAANLPNAPAVVKEAAAQYQSSNPVSAWFSGSTLGIPNYLLAGGGGLLILIPLLKSGKRR
jgi:hypothetical protein